MAWPNHPFEGMPTHACVFILGGAGNARHGSMPATVGADGRRDRVRGGEMAKKKQHKDQPQAPASSVASREAGPPAKLKRKAYETEMRRLHGELVAMQEWVKATGAKLCVVFEGRDTAGKGGTIKRITERVSPRTFRVVALAAPT